MNRDTVVTPSSPYKKARSMIGRMLIRPVPIERRSAV
jgi:hypothetical protein